MYIPERLKKITWQNMDFQTQLQDVETTFFVASLRKEKSKRLTDSTENALPTRCWQHCFILTAF